MCVGCIVALWMWQIFHIDYKKLLPECFVMCSFYFPVASTNFNFCSCLITTLPLYESDQSKTLCTKIKKKTYCRPVGCQKDASQWVASLHQLIVLNAIIMIWKLYLAYTEIIFNEKKKYWFSTPFILEPTHLAIWLMSHFITPHHFASHPICNIYLILVKVIRKKTFANATTLFIPKIFNIILEFMQQNFA